MSAILSKPLEFGPSLVSVTIDASYYFYFFIYGAEARKIEQTKHQQQDGKRTCFGRPVESFRFMAQHLHL